MGLLLGKKLTYYTSVAKGLKLNVRRFLGLILAFLKVTEKELVGGGVICPPPDLNRVKSILFSFLSNAMTNAVFEYC